MVSNRGTTSWSFVNLGLLKWFLGCFLRRNDVYIGWRIRDKMTARPFYDTGKIAAFSFLSKLQAAVNQAKGKISTPETQAWLERQDA